MARVSGFQLTLVQPALELAQYHSISALAGCDACTFSEDFHFFIWIIQPEKTELLSQPEKILIFFLFLASTKLTSVL
jgi:hypothetical protein